MGNCQFKETKGSSKNFEDIALTETERREHADRMVKLLKPLRFRLGITQREVGEIIGMTMVTYGEIENNRRELTWRYFLALLFFYSNNLQTKEMIQESGIISQRLTQWLNICKL